MKRNDFIKEFERLVKTGEITNHMGLQVAGNVSRTRVNTLIKEGKYKEIKVNKNYVLISTDHE